jgi:NADH-quinone oxidoreductase subunit A
MTGLVSYLLIFLAVAVFFVFIHLMLGKLIRPSRPSPEKLTIYECGEPTIGSAWIQFDLRFYVVALLFVIFDVEVAFFFPWAVVFGKATQLAQPVAIVGGEERVRLTNELIPAAAQNPGEPAPRARRSGELASEPRETVISPAAGSGLAWLAFWDILVFFGVLLVGFAYLWKRGDLDWVRSTLAEETHDGTTPPASVPTPSRPADRELVGAGRHS